MNSLPQEPSSSVIEQGQRARFHRIRWIATGLLVVMAVLYGFARSLESEDPIWPWVRAFAEAGMIGALADWFAVTALFRRPLGLPIPHTAIVREQKDRIGQSLAKFVRSNFLTPEVLGAQVRRLTPIKRACAWFGKPENAKQIWSFLGQQVSDSPAIFDEVEMRRWAKKLANSTCDKLENTPVETHVGKWMADSMHGAEFRAVIAPLFKKLSFTVSDSRKWVESEASERAPMADTRIISRITRGITEAVSGRMVDQLAEQLEDACKDTSHPFYEKLENALREIGEELQEGDSGHGEWSAWRRRIFSNAGFNQTFEDFIFRLGEYALKERVDLLGKIGETFSNTAARLAEEEGSLDVLEEKSVAVVMQLSDHYGDEFEKVVSQTVENWEAETLIEKLETSVGADLQFIRINGTLIGGLIGLALHGLGHFIWPT